MKTSKVNTQKKEKRFSEQAFLLFISKTLYLNNQRELTKEDTIKRKDILCSWIGRINIVNISILPTTNLQIQLNPTVIPMAFFNYMIVQKKKNYRDSIQISDCQELGRER